MFITPTSVWGRGEETPPKKGTEFSLVFHLLHNSSDCCEIETVLPTALRQIK